nr:hypothetical protein [uncultured Desulfobacter sp.]
MLPKGKTVMVIIVKTTHASIHFAFFSAPEHQNIIPIAAKATIRKSGRMTIQINFDNQKNNDPDILKDSERLK